jgi:hypothetical protein
VKAVIDVGHGRIRDLVAKHDDRALVDSADPDDTELLGQGVFEVGVDVRACIVVTLRQIAARPAGQRSPK